MKIKAMNYYDLREVLEKELDIEWLDGVYLIGYEMGSKKVKTVYGNINHPDSLKYTASPNLMKQINNNIKKGSYYIDYPEGGDIGTYVYVPVNGAKFTKIHDESYIVCKNGSMFDCKNATWFDSLKSMLISLERSK